VLKKRKTRKGMDDSETMPFSESVPTTRSLLYHRRQQNFIYSNQTDSTSLSCESLQLPDISYSESLIARGKISKTIQNHLAQPDLSHRPVHGSLHCFEFSR
jgi:hypothetical protein